jgi:hypothetical protein
MTRAITVAIALAAMCCHTHASLVFDPGNDSYAWFSSNANTIYDQGRGLIFHANEDFTISSVGLTNHVPRNTSITYEIHRITQTLGDLLPGSTLLSSTTFTTSRDGLVDHHTPIDEVSIVAGEDYLLRAVYEEDSIENWFYLFDTVVRPDEPVHLGSVTLLESTAAFNTANFLLPKFTINVPTPSTLAPLTFTALLTTRRRR